MDLLETDGERLLTAVRALLERKGVVSAAEIAERRAATDNASPGQGAKMVAKAWLEPDFKTRMLADGTKAAEALNIPMRGMPPLGVLEQTPEVHNLVVCACAAAIRAASWVIRHFGISPPPIAPAPFAIRVSCWPRSGRRSFRIQFSCGWWIPRRTIVGWCCRCVRQAPRAGTRRSSPRSSAKAT